MGLGVAEREQIAKRAATEIKQGMIVNLGIGIPSLVPNFCRLTCRSCFKRKTVSLALEKVPKREKRMRIYATPRAILSAL